ncbi:hypothetical protein P3S37_25860, partial [Enterobacter hormaechei]|uniref:hypothetical protein n=1 Tax=Enterobacter hormaechei TaxID=158836 RepID=UPI0023E427BC
DWDVCTYGNVIATLHQINRQPKGFRVVVWLVANQDRWMTLSRNAIGSLWSVVNGGVVAVWH